MDLKKVFVSCVALALAVVSVSAKEKKQTTGEEDRQVWVNTLIKIADPVLSNLANNTLRANMPQESLSSTRPGKFSHLEAVGRTVCGIAPWLELGEDDTKEGKLRGKYIRMTLKGLANAVDPASPDYLDFATPAQPLVDAAFLAQGLLRAPKQLWEGLDETTRGRMIAEFKRSRVIKPYESNWLLFASMVEAALLEFTGECDMQRLTYGVNKFRDKWYVGDGVYGDGPKYHADYYNSFVIHPMLTDVLRIMAKHKMKEAEDFLPVQLKRHIRYAEQLERMVSPEGAYPVVGRSIVYRVGAFHALAHVALLRQLPKTVSPAQVRCAMTAVIARQFAAPKTFDKKGWLRIGFAGSQINMSETYINTGSTYLCASGFLALGLPPTDPFWSEPFAAWTGLKAWNGEDVKADHAIGN